MLEKFFGFQTYIPFFIILLFTSCSRMGYGVLLWSTEEPLIHSGTVMPVYLRSNIEQIWVVGIPKELLETNGENEIINDKVEIPLPHFEFTGRSRRRAASRAQNFAPYASLYAENLQDGLPIRDNPDNSARRVYRLRQGEIIKILSSVRGNPPISTTGEPLPGEWYRVLTEDGVTGFCFSNRLRIFDDYEESFFAVASEHIFDAELEAVLERHWSPDSYLQMINSRRIIISELEKRYGFDPGYETKVARIRLPDIELEIPYENIVSQEGRSWRFESSTGEASRAGSNLQMELRTNNTLAVQFNDPQTGLRRSALFVALSGSINDIIAGENARRNSQFRQIFDQGPVFTSNNYGTITFTRNGNFTWTGFDLLVPELIPAGTSEEGRVLMDIFIDNSFMDRYDGALTLRFSGSQTTLYFMYSLDNQGMRLEVVPGFAIEDSVVMRRLTSPMVLYFFIDR